MRTKEEVMGELVVNGLVRSQVLALSVIAEVLLDIRDLLANKPQ